MTPVPESHGPQGATSLETARRIMQREVGELPGANEHDERAIVERSGDAVLRVLSGLSRSFGSFGAQALLSRALSRARVTHPVLAPITMSEATAPVDPHTAFHSVFLSALTASADVHGAGAVLLGVTAWLAELGDLMSELIGDDLANTLLMQSAERRLPSVVGRDSFGAIEGASHARRVGEADHTHQRRDRDR